MSKIAPAPAPDADAESLVAEPVAGPVVAAPAASAPVPDATSPPVAQATSTIDTECWCFWFGYGAAALFFCIAFLVAVIPPRPTLHRCPANAVTVNIGEGHVCQDVATLKLVPDVTIVTYSFAWVLWVLLGTCVGAWCGVPCCFLDFGNSLRRGNSRRVGACFCASLGVWMVATLLSVAVDNCATASCPVDTRSVSLSGGADELACVRGQDANATYVPVNYARCEIARGQEFGASMGVMLYLATLAASVWVGYRYGK